MGTKVMSSKNTVPSAAERGRSIRRTRAERASAGAWTGPVVRKRKAGASSPSSRVESCCASAVPEPSALAYQETRSQAAATAGSSFST
ncbi:hypothetical protein HRbin24_01796 [bacterium HR24]|nr:hypothetical protein HRbin24_01796 [bacterium HR24]